MTYNEIKRVEDLLEHIKCLQVEKEALIAGQETLQKALAEKNAEIERFKKIETTVHEFWNVLQKFTKEKLKEKPTLEELLEYIEHAKAEAIKEFAERLEANFEISSAYSFGYIACQIDNLVKEMTEPSLLDKKFGGDTK